MVNKNTYQISVGGDGRVVFEREVRVGSTVLASKYINKIMLMQEFLKKVP